MTTQPSCTCEHDRVGHAKRCSGSRKGFCIQDLSIGRHSKAALEWAECETTVRAPERLQAMVRQRRVWAEEGLDADVIEKMYQDSVNYFIDEEMKHWKQSETK